MATQTESINIAAFCGSDYYGKVGGVTGNVVLSRPVLIDGHLYAGDRSLGIRIPCGGPNTKPARAGDLILPWPKLFKRFPKCTLPWPEIMPGEATIDLGRAHVVRLYWAMIRSLPNVMYAPPRNSKGPVKFAFDGGQGVVMPYDVMKTGDQ
jgi:hypothetical protein